MDLEDLGLLSLLPDLLWFDNCDFLVFLIFILILTIVLLIWIFEQRNQVLDLVEEVLPLPKSESLHQRGQDSLDIILFQRLVEVFQDHVIGPYHIISEESGLMDVRSGEELGDDECG